MTWTKEQRKEYMKAYRQAHKDKFKAYRQEHKEQHKAYMKAYNKAHKEEAKAYYQVWHVEHKEQVNEYKKAYYKAEMNSQGQTKSSIRQKSQYILKQMNLKIPDYEIHHCFGYDDASKFIYISKSLHLKIHQYLRDNNIDAGKDHWMQIRDIVNSTDEFMYIKC